MSGISASAPVACRDSVARLVFPITTWDRFARTMPPPVCFWVARWVARISQTRRFPLLGRQELQDRPGAGDAEDHLVNLVDLDHDRGVVRGRLEHRMAGLGERGGPL